MNTDELKARLTSLWSANPAHIPDVEVLPNDGEFAEFEQPLMVEFAGTRFLIVADTRTWTVRLARTFHQGKDAPVDHNGFDCGWCLQVATFGAKDADRFIHGYLDNLAHIGSGLSLDEIAEHVREDIVEACRIGMIYPGWRYEVSVGTEGEDAGKIVVDIYGVPRHGETDIDVDAVWAMVTVQIVEAYGGSGVVKLHRV